MGEVKVAIDFQKLFLVIQIDSISFVAAEQSTYGFRALWPWISGSSLSRALHATTFPAAFGHSPLPGRQRPSDGPLRFPQTPFQCPRSRKATLEPQLVQPSRRPDCTLSRVVATTAEEYDRPVTQSIATRSQVALVFPRFSRSSLKPWMCHHTREPTELSGVSCRPFR